MAVQVWIGEKPEHPNERRAIVALANGLERMDGLYLLLANFHVGGRTIDLTIIKHDAIFIIELKHCDGRVLGGVNGPWFLENPNGERKRLNPGRSNPYNQVLSYYHNLTNFLSDHATQFLSEHKARSTNMRSSRRLIVIAPTIFPGSEIELDWKVEVKGLDELPSFLVTESSKEIDLTDEEMLAIPALLGCTRWRDINELIAGIIPAWNAEPPVQSQPLTAAGASTTETEKRAAFITRARTALRTFTGPLALALSVLTLVLLLFTVLHPLPDTPPAPPQSSIIATSPPAGGISGGGREEEISCVWSGFQPVGKRWDGQTRSWISVGVDGTAPVLSPEVVVTLEQVNYCNSTLTLTWSVRNNSKKPIAFPLTGENITVRDPLGNTYQVDDTQSEPQVVRVQPGDMQHGVAVLTGPVVPDAPSLLVRLKDKPFGEASWLVSLSTVDF